MAGANSGLRVVPAHAGHVPFLLADQQEAERAEIRRTGEEPEDAVRRNLSSASMAWTAFFGPDVAAIFGVVPYSIVAGQGIPFMFTTGLVQRHRLTFVRMGRVYVARMKETFPVLFNVVDAKHPTGCRTLAALGFRVTDPKPIPPYGDMFHGVVVN